LRRGAPTRATPKRLPQSTRTGGDESTIRLAVSPLFESCHPALEFVEFLLKVRSDLAAESRPLGRDLESCPERDGNPK
jgi:hypothetical protein